MDNKPNLPPWFANKVAQMLSEMIAKRLEDASELYQLACGHDSRLTYDCPICNKCNSCCTCEEIK